jgi:sulfur-oxidizing protein SoxX
MRISAQPDLKCPDCITNIIGKEETMRNPATRVIAATGVLLFGSLSLTANFAIAAEMSAVEEGKAVTLDRKTGNCIACHAMAGGDQAGNIGPELVNIKMKYPDKAALRNQIWDATTVNPNTIMPPYGKHKILKEEEIDKVVEYIYTL